MYHIQSMDCYRGYVKSAMVKCNSVPLLQTATYANKEQIFVPFMIFHKSCIIISFTAEIFISICL